MTAFSKAGRSMSGFLIFEPGECFRRGEGVSLKTWLTIFALV